MDDGDVFSTLLNMNTNIIMWSSVYSTLETVHCRTQLVSRWAWQWNNGEDEHTSTNLYIARLGPRETDGAGGWTGGGRRIDYVSNPDLCGDRKYRGAE